MSYKLKTTVAAAALSFASFGTASTAKTFDLAFIMDESGSVAPGDHTAAMNSLASALEASLAGNPTDTYNVSVITFSSGVNATYSATIAPNSTAAAIQSALTTAVRVDGYSDGSTCYSCAFGALGSSAGDAGIINMMTDGEPTSGVTSLSALQAQLVGVRADGWDSLSFEAVGNFGGVPASGFLAQLAFDMVGTGTQPIFTDPSSIADPLNASFVLEVDSFGDAYDAAISTKVQKLVDPDPIAPVPLPAGLPLLLTGLGVFGAIRMRKSRKAAA